MLSPKTQTNLKSAQEYFREHLQVGDYYSEGQTTQGAWLGIGAEQLGLRAEVGQAEFLALCENFHPTTGRTLTQQQKLGRIKTRDNTDQADPKRRVFYDFTISAPKSVSIVALIGGDQGIVEAHEKAVGVAMIELEKFSSTRVRIGGASSDRETGNVVGARFHHDTSRALDPHLHTHCIVFNATFDPVENRWKALQNFEMLRAQKYVENVYYHELARSLIGLGYEITNNRRGDFDLKGLSAEVLLKFSKRHVEIDEKLAVFLKENPQKQDGNVAQMREYLAHKDRSRKIHSTTPENLRLLWKAQLEPGENEMLSRLLKSPQSPKTEPESGVDAALSLAEQHVFNRRSVVSEHELWRYALEFGRGGAFDVAELKAATKNRPYIRDKLRPNRITTQEVLAREWEIVQLAKAGACLHPSFHTGFEPANTLDSEQQKAVGRILRSGDFVTLFRGAAGTGKSFALQEVLRGLKAADHEVQVIAPQRQQVLDLNASGIGPASTVTEFLNRKAVSLGAVVILDEAGQLGAEQMRELLRLLKQSGGRLICSGDTRQHGAVESSDALRALEKYAALKSIELKTIRRQDPARAKTTKERVAIQEYRKAVQEASEGLAIESFQRLEQLGAVIECGFGAQQTVLAEHYVSLVATNESALIVAQTWSEIGKLNEHIRDALKLNGLIGSTEKKVAVLEAVDLTDAQKRDARYYEPGAVLVFNRDIAGIRKHEKGKLLAVIEGAVVVQTAGRIRQIPFAELGRFTVCRERDLGVSVGDRLQLKANATTTDGRPLTNGELVTVAKVRPCGGVELADGRVLGAAYRQFGHGYAVTSYASQGKTVDHVLFSDAAVKAATSQEQWYVTISRGRKSVRIFTEDKEQLRENVARAGHRELALDLNGVPSSDASIRRKPQTSTQRLIEEVRRRVSWAAIKARVAGITKTVGQNI